MIASLEPGTAPGQPRVLSKYLMSKQSYTVVESEASFLAFCVLNPFHAVRDAGAIGCNLSINRFESIFIIALPLKKVG